MTLVVGDIPDSHADRAAWLDRELVGDRLGELTAELAGVNGPGTTPVGLGDVLGPYREDILRRGLAAAPEAVVRGLMRRPELLLELQAEVFVSGGPYWRTLPRPARLHDAAVSGWERIADRLTAESPIVPLTLARPPRRRWALPFVAVSLAIGLVGGGWFLRGAVRPDRAQPTWGWAGGLPADPDSVRYLDRLAALAEEWDDDRPTDRDALVARLGEFRDGCGVVLVADHPALSEAQRRDLWDSCRQWSAAIDGLIARAHTGDDPAVVRGEADALVRRLAAALRGRITERA